MSFGNEGFTPFFFLMSVTAFFTIGLTSPSGGLKSNLTSLRLGMKHDDLHAMVRFRVFCGWPFSQNSEPFFDAMSA
jgi:hypothetical protein